MIWKGFFNSTTKFTSLIKENVMNLTDLNGYNEKEFEANLDEGLKPFLITYLFDKDLQSGQHHLAENYPRKCVAMSDTDSLFVKSDMLITILSETINKEVIVPSDHDLDVYMFRFISYFATLLTDYPISIMTKQHHNIKGEHRYKYKSEFLYRKILLLKTKKTYCGTITVQEGHKVEPFFDEKNLNKTSYTQPSKDFVNELVGLFTNIDKDYKLPEIFEIVSKHKETVRQLIFESKDPRVGQPKKFKAENFYDDAWSVINFIAGEIYNVFHPENKLQSGTRIFTIDLLMPQITGASKKSESDIVTEILAFYAERLPEVLYTEFERILQEENYNSSMRTYILKPTVMGIPYIGIPLGEELPDWVIDLCNIEEIVMKNVDVRSVNFLEAVGIFVDKNTKRTNVTNIIKF